jgi:hypothetical protein
VLFAGSVTAYSSFLCAGTALTLALWIAPAHAREPLSLKGQAAHRPAPNPHSVWLGLALQQDAAIAGGTDVCTRDAQLNNGFSCFRQSGSQYHGTPIMGVNDSVGSGLLLATTRFVLGGDLLVADDLALGVRAGWAFRGGGPTPDGGKAFKPYSADLRLSYFVSGPAFSPDGFSPYVFLAGGVMQVDAKIGVDVVEDPNVPPPPNQPDNPPSQHLDAYKKMGFSFAGAGLGAYLPASAANGARFELGLAGLFPSSGLAAFLSAGWVFGV